MKGFLFWFRQAHVLQRTAFLLAFVLFSHGFDSCSAHLAGSANMAKIGVARTTTSSVTSTRAALGLCSCDLDCSSATCFSCQTCRSHESPGDGCEVTSEIMTLLSGDHWKFAPSTSISVPVGAVVPDIIDLMPSAPPLPIRDGIDVPALFSTLCRNPLSGRAPPASA